jgi:phage antirepressor YoqD-like protein
LTDAAKTLQIQPKKLTQMLQEQHWIYRRPMGTRWLAYQERIQQGLLEHKVTTGEKSDGSEWTSTQPRITPKGLTKLAEAVRQAGLH